MGFYARIREEARNGEGKPRGNDRGMVTIEPSRPGPGNPVKAAKPKIVHGVRTAIDTLCLSRYISRAMNKPEIVVRRLTK